MEVSGGEDDCHLVGEIVEGLWHIANLIGKFGIVDEVAFNAVMESGDLLMELEVLLLQWGHAALGHPLGYHGDDLWHWWFGFWVLGLGSVFSCVQCPVGYTMCCDEITVRLMVP